MVLGLALALLRHLALLALVFVPVSLLVTAGIQTLRGASGGDGLLDLTLLYPGWLLYSLPGVALYTLALASVTAGTASHRIAPIVLAPLIVVSWFAFPGRSLLWSIPVSAGLLAGLLVFGLLASRWWRPLRGRLAPA